MAAKKILVISFVFVTVFNLYISNAQHFIGNSGGFCKGTFTNFSKKENYNANYHLKNGAAFSSFYDTKMDSTSNFRVELQYQFQSADMAIKNNARYASFYKNIDYSFQLLNLNLIYSFQLFEKRSFKLYFLLGPTFSYNINTDANGNGWEFYYHEQIDTNGNSIQILTTRNWKKNESNSKDLSQFNFGFAVELDFAIPLANKLDLLLQNSYNIFLTNITTLDDLRHTFLLAGHLNIGLRYELVFF